MIGMYVYIYISIYIYMYVFASLDYKGIIKKTNINPI